MDWGVCFINIFFCSFNLALVLSVVAMYIWRGTHSEVFAAFFWPFSKIISWLWECRLLWTERLCSLTAWSKARWSCQEIPLDCCRFWIPLSVSPLTLATPSVFIMYENKCILCILSASDSRASLVQAEEHWGAYSFPISFPAVEPVENVSAGICFPCLHLKFRQSLVPWFLPWTGFFLPLFLLMLPLHP